MNRKANQNWDNFINQSCDLLSSTAINTRLSLKYKNKPSRGRVEVTNNSKRHRFLFKETNSIERLDEFTKKVFHLLANKKLVEEEKMEVDCQKGGKKNEKKDKKGKKK
jgi:hypothetical protein